MKQKMIDFLLENANPSIKLRVKKEILKDISEEEENNLRELIMSEKIVQTIAGCQKENGWLGNGYHGSNRNAGRYTNMEVGVKYLAEKGLYNSDVINRAMNAFNELPHTDPCYRNSWHIDDEFKYAANGANLFRCACIARAGYEPFIDIVPQIQLALDSFHRVLEVDSILDITHLVKKGTQRVFIDYEKWPCRYHLDILAHTNSWKSEEMCSMIAESVLKIMRTDRPELLGLCADSWVSGHVLRTCACFPSQGFMLADIIDGVPYYHLEYLVWLARCGVIPYCSKLREMVKNIYESVNEEGVCEIAVYDYQFKDWGPYAGLQLETDWKSKVRKNCDITFRALQLCYYSGLD